MWISTEERLPTESQKVFYYFDVVGVHAGSYEFNPDNGPVLGQVFYCDKGFLSGDVTHWMPREDGQPLPEPPEEG